MKHKVIYYTDEERDEFSEIKWKEKDFSYEDYEGEHPFFRFILIRILGIPLARIYMKGMFGHHIINASRKIGEDEGFFIYGNHTNAIPDVLIPFLLFGKRTIHVVAGRGNCAIPIIGKLLPAVGAIPLPRGKKETLMFRELIERAVVRNQGIMVYPEAHIWPFYTGIRHFSEASMGYPARFDVPCYVVTNIYRRRRLCRKPRMVTYVDGPFYPDMESGLLDRKMKLRDEIYNTMVRRSMENNAEYVTYIKKPNLTGKTEQNDIMGKREESIETEGRKRKFVEEEAVAFSERAGAMERTGRR